MASTTNQINSLAEYRGLEQTLKEMRERGLALRAKEEEARLAGDVEKARWARGKLEGMADWFARTKSQMQVYQQANPFVCFDPRRKDLIFTTDDGQELCPWNPSQAEPYEWWLAGGKRIAVMGGSKSGKTTLLIGKMCIEEALKGPGREVYVLADSKEALRSDVHRIQWEIRCTSDLAPTQRAYVKGEGFGRDNPTLLFSSPEWEGETSIIQYRSYEAGLKEFKYAKAHGVAFNEEPPTVVWIDEALSRVSTTGGWVAVSATFLYGNAVSQRLERKDVPDEERFECFNLDARDNPTQDREALNRKKKVWGPEVWNARVLGIPQQLRGRCYTNFKREHPWLVEKAPPRVRLATFEMLDSHPVKPWTYALGGVDREGIIWWLKAFAWPKEKGLMEFFRAVWAARFARSLSSPEWESIRPPKQERPEEQRVVRRRRHLPIDIQRLVPHLLGYDSADKEIRHGDTTTMAARLRQGLLVKVVDAQRLPHADRIPTVDDVLIGAYNAVLDVEGEGTLDKPIPLMRWLASETEPFTEAMEIQGWKVWATERAREEKGVNAPQKAEKGKDWTDLADYAVAMLRGFHRLAQEQMRKAIPREERSEEEEILREMKRRQNRANMLHQVTLKPGMSKGPRDEGKPRKGILDLLPR